MFRDALNAVRFLTVLPLPSAKDHQPDDLARSMFFFPAVGLLIAALSYGLYTVAEFWLPPRIAVLVLLISPVLLSGGLHVDGFADFCDGFFGGKDRESILRIMKDPSVGAFGATGVAFLMLLKFELLWALPFQTAVFFLALAAGRWSQVALSFFLPYAGTGGGISEQVAGKNGRREMLGASLFLALPLFWMPKGLVIVAAWAPLLFLLGLYFKRKIGGVTGDLFGAASELAEVFVLLMGVAMIGGGQ